MRISTRRKPWLVAALGSLLGSASVANANMVTFTLPVNSSAPSVAVYHDWDIQNKPVTWSAINSMKIDVINLYVFDGGQQILIGSSESSQGGNIGGGGSVAPLTSPVATTTMSSSVPVVTISSLSLTTASRVSKRAGSPVNRLSSETGLSTSYIALTVTSSFAGGGAVIIPEAQTLADDYFNKMLYFGAVLPNNTGFSYSRAFNVVANDASFASASLNPVFSNSSAVLPDSAGPSNSGPSSIGIQPAPTSTTTSTPAEGGTAERGGEGGLPKGAIAGIAVACGIVGLALIAGCCWWFCVARPRRRQRQQQDAAFAGGTYATDRSRTQELIAEKEANGGVEVSPHSPYSDDGGMMAANGTTAAAVAAPAAVMAHHHQLQQQTHDRSYSPYSDDRAAAAAAAAAAGERGVGGSVPPSTHAPSVLHAEGDPRASTASGIPVARSPTLSTSRSAGAPVSAQYAHLVEEGMTEDEIRRLEEEERQLDAAIEQAGRR